MGCATAFAIVTRSDGDVSRIDAVSLASDSHPGGIDLVTNVKLPIFCARAGRVRNRHRRVEKATIIDHPDEQQQHDREDHDELNGRASPRYASATYPSAHYHVLLRASKATDDLDDCRPKNDHEQGGEDEYSHRNNHFKRSRRCFPLGRLTPLSAKGFG